MAILKRSKWLLLVVGLIAIGAFAISGKLSQLRESKTVAKNEGPQKSESIFVTCEPPVSRVVKRSITAVGSLWGWDEVPITPKVEGRVLRIFKDVGDLVKPGDVLLEIDPTDYRLAVTEAERSLDLELARLGIKDLPPGEIDLTKLPAVLRAESLEKQANARYARLRVGSRAVTDEELQQAQTDVEVAKSNYQQAILESRATLASARQKQAVLETARQWLLDTKIVAPAPIGLRDAGVKSTPEYVISFRKVTEGEIMRIIPLVDAPPMFRLVIDRPLKLQVTLAERYRSEIKMGQDVELEVESIPNEKFAGKLSRISPAIDRTNRTFTVEVLIPNEDRRLSAGSFVKAAIITKADDKMTTIPEEALVSFAGVNKVFVVKDDKASEVQVKVGNPIIVVEGGKKRTWIEVEGKLPPRSRVITSGHSRLADGMPITIRDEVEKGSK